MITNNNIFFGRDIGIRFKFDAQNKMVIINPAVRLIDSKLRDIIYEEARTALKIYLEKINKTHHSTAKKEALNMAQKKIDKKYPNQRKYAYKELKRELYKYRDRNEMFDLRSELREMQSLKYFKNIKIPNKYSNNRNINQKFHGPCGEMFSYDISDASDVKFINTYNQIFDDNLTSDSSLPKLRDKMRLNIEKCGIESIAFYRSYHFSQDEFGIYIKLKQFINTVIDIREKSLLTLKEAKDLALNLLLRHETFHYITELFITFSEFNQKDFDIYYSYKNKYISSFGSKECYEETLANAYIIESIEMLSIEEYNYLNEFFGRQSGGYKEAKDLSDREKYFKYLKLENQILDNKIRHSQIKNFFINHPSAKLFNSDKFNLPVYLIDNTENFNKEEKSEEIIIYKIIKNILFPNLFDNDFFNFADNLSIHYSESNTWLHPKIKDIEIKYPDKYFFRDEIGLNIKQNYKRISMDKVNLLWYIIQAVDFNKLNKRKFNSGAMDVTRWNLNIKYANKNLNFEGDYASKNKYPFEIRYLLKELQNIISEIEDSSINLLNYEFDIKLKNNVDKNKINNLIRTIEEKNKKFQEKSSHLRQELKVSNYKYISILSYNWLAGWANSGGPYKNVEADVDELCRNLFNYELDKIININNKKINLKEFRDDQNKVEKIKDDVIEYHEDKLKNAGKI